MYRTSSTLILMGILFPIRTILGIDFHVSADGRDSNPGTQENPWGTLARIQRQVMNPGDRILLRGGDRFRGSIRLHPQSRGTPESPIEIGSYGTGRAVIHARDSSAVLVRNTGGIIVRDLEVSGRNRTDMADFGICILNDRPGNHRLEYVRIRHVTASGFKFAGIYIGGVPTNLPGFQAPQGCRYGFQDVAIEQCSAYENLYYGIYVSSPWYGGIEDYGNANVVIRDCAAYDNPGDSTYTENHSGSGIMLDDTEGGLIEYCTAFRNGALNAGLPGGPVGIWTHASTRVCIQFCESFSNRTGGVADGGGFDLDGGVTSSVIQYCYSHDNDGAGFLVWNWDGAPHRLGDNIIQHCISENDGRKHGYGAFHVGSSGTPVRNIQIFNNTVYMKPAFVGSPKALWIGGRPGQEVLFFNNVLVVSGGLPFVEIETEQNNLLIAENLYWAEDGRTLWKEGERLFDSIKTWRKSTGRETLRGRNTGKGSDPKWSGCNRGETVGYPRRLSELESYRPLQRSPLLEKGLSFSELGVEPAIPGIQMDENPGLGARFRP